MPRRENRTSRRSPVHADRLRVLVVCGGKVTEPQYLKGLRNSVRSRALDLDFTAVPRSPTDVVAAAIRRSGPDFDEVWCVFDVDQFDIREAVRRAREREVNLAISNPCFELWLLLHFERCNSHLRGYEAVVVKLKKHVPDYDKSVSFRHFEGRVTTAIANAKQLDASGTDHSKNPSTSVWRLVETIVGRDE